MKNLNKFLTMAAIAMTSLSAGAISVTFNVNVGDAVKMKVSGYSGGSKEYTLAEGNTTLDLEEYDYIEAEGIDPYVLKSVTNAAGTPEYLSVGIWYKSVYETDEGQTYNLTVANKDDLYTASFNMNVDDPTFVEGRFNSGRIVKPNAGENIVKYDPDAENRITIRSTNWDKPLYNVTLDGVDVEAYYGSYEVAITQGCTVDVTAIIPDGPVVVNFTYGDKAEGAIAGVLVDGEEYESFDGKTVNMRTGQKLTLVPNYSYDITQMTLDGEDSWWYGGYNYSTDPLMKDMEIHVEAHPYATIPCKVNVSDPAHIKLYKGSRYNNDLVNLTSTENDVEVTEVDPLLTWEAAPGCYIVSVKINGEAYTADNVTVTENMVIDIETGAINMDKSAVVWIDNLGAVDTFFSFQTATRLQLGDDFTSGYNLVEFYDGYNPFGLSWYSQNPVVGKAYLNDTLLEPMYEGSTTFEFALEDRDVVKLFFGNEPVKCNVSFTVGEGLDASVVRDIIKTVEDWRDGFSCFGGTTVVVSEAGTALDVKVNGVKVQPVDNTDRVADPQATLDNASSYEFVVNDPATTVEISKAAGTGIDSVSDTGSGSVAVFNLQGMKVADSLENVPAGIYIVAGKKVVVK